LFKPQFNTWIFETSFMCHCFKSPDESLEQEHFNDMTLYRD